MSEGSLKISCFQSSFCGQEQFSLDQVAQSLSQSGLEHSQRCDICNFSGQPIPMPRLTFVALGCCCGVLTWSLSLFFFKLLVMKWHYLTRGQRQVSGLVSAPNSETTVGWKGRIPSSIKIFHTRISVNEVSAWTGMRFYISCCIFTVKTCISFSQFLSLELLLSVNCIGYAIAFKWGHKHTILGLGRLHRSRKKVLTKVYYS